MWQQALAACCGFSKERRRSDQLPNIVYVLCDDLGYGDVQCLVPNTSKIPTPNADQLAAEGMCLRTPILARPSVLPRDMVF